MIALLSLNSSGQMESFTSSYAPKALAVHPQAALQVIYYIAPGKHRSNLDLISMIRNMEYFALINKVYCELLRKSPAFKN